MAKFTANDEQLCKEISFTHRQVAVIWIHYSNTRNHIMYVQQGRKQCIQGSSVWNLAPSCFEVWNCNQWLSTTPPLSKHYGGWHKTKMSSRHLCRRRLFTEIKYYCIYHQLILWEKKSHQPLFSHTVVCFQPKWKGVLQHCFLVVVLMQIVYTTAWNREAFVN